MQCVHPASSRVLTLSDGRSIDLLERLGRGTYGTVYRGVVESGWGVRRPVAVKLIELAPDADPGEAMRRLARIARRAAGIQHPAVIQLFEIDRTGGIGEAAQPFSMMELVEGESLASLVDGWRSIGLRVPIDFATVVTLRAAEALGAALFTDGVDGSLTALVHGDLSPRQILVSSQGEVKLGDFGQSALLCDRSSHVRSRSRLAYTAPEVACGAPPNARSDVFSLGVILHELLLGPRFAAGTSIGDAMQMVRDGHVYSSALEPNISRPLRDVIDTATQRNAMARYAHARAMAFDLRRAMLQLGLMDTQTCVRHSVVGWCEVRGGASGEAPVRQPSQSEIVPQGESGTHPALEERESGITHTVRNDFIPSFDVEPSFEDTQPSIPRALRGR